MKKQILSMIFTVLMLIGMLSLTVLAEETSNISVTAYPEEGGTVTKTVNGDYVTVTATANNGFTFGGWYTDNLSNVISFNPSHTFEITEYTDLFAVFDANIYEINITIQNSERGTVYYFDEYEECTIEDFQYFSLYHGETINLIATPNAGYRFVNWTKDGIEVSTQREVTFTVDCDCTYTANFDKNAYTIAASVAPESTGTITGTGDFQPNSTVTLTATPKDNFIFVNWTENNKIVSTESVYTFTADQNRNLTANFAPAYCDVSVATNNQEQGTITIKNPETAPVAYGTMVTIEAIPATHYKFIGLTMNGNPITPINNIFSFIVTEDVSLVAFFKPLTYYVSAVSNNENYGIAHGAGEHDYGTTATLTATPAVGYHFVNWTDGSTVISSDANYSFTVTGDVNYTANFAINTYDITATTTPAEGGTIEGAETYNHGSTATLTATANEGYTFVNWTKDSVEVSTDAQYSFDVIGTSNFVANFKLKSYSINAYAYPEAGTVTGGGTYNHGAEVTLTASPNTGYIFTNWTNKGEIISEDPTITIIANNDEAYVANFVKSVTISASSNDENGGTITGAGTYAEGASVTLTAAANSGYTFVNWTQDGAEVSTDAEYTFTATEAASYVANFTLNSYEITATANPAEGGTVTGGGTYNRGDEVILTATANSGYTFVNWTQDDTVVSTDAEYTFTATAAGTYTANWTYAPLTGTVTITGMTDNTPKVGDILTATVTDTNNTGTLSYQWYRQSENSEMIDGAADQTYQVTEEDVRYALYCVVTSNNQTEKITSSHTMPTAFLQFPENAIFAVGYNGTYDGLSHSITVIGPEGCSVYYGTSESDCDFDTVPTFSDAGIYTVYYRVAKSNYRDVTGSAVVTILPQELTITADNKEVYVGSRQPALTYTVEGLVGDDILISEPELTTNAKMNRAGNYTITAAGANAGSNYSITYVNGTLKVKNYPYVPVPTSDIKTADDIDNGTVSTNTKSASNGSTVTITVTPDDGYVLTELTVTDSFGNTIALTDIGDNKYTFRMPSSDIIIHAEFETRISACTEGEDCPIHSYSDLKTELWYHDGIHFCLENGLMQGVSSDQFAPDLTTTRAMIVTMLWRLEGSPVVDYLMNFDDVASDMWYTEAIRWAASEKLIEGYGNGLFGTDDAITREQIATIMHRFAKYKGLDTEVHENTALDFDDPSDVADWAITAMKWAYGSKMIYGIPKDDAVTLKPQDSATRAQAAAILQRFCENT